VTAGFVDPGWRSGRITLELSNQAPWILELHPGQRIAQIRFTLCSGSAVKPYGHPDLGSKYQGQQGTTPATGKR
jgi:dCTP deaminase